MADQTNPAAHIAAHLANARPRALAALTRHFRDLDLAEDAFQEAAARALVSWREKGLPRDPTAWLIFAGRNAALDRIRKDSRHRNYVMLSATDDYPSGNVELELADQIDMNELRDDILRLLFMCCQPDLAVADQLALALKVVGGFSVPQIAKALLVAPKAMEQRITRAKKKAAAIAADLDPPSMQQRGDRLNAVALMVYLMFNEGYSAGGGPDHIRTELCEEAIRLARLLLSLFPSQPELMGLLALCLIQHSRRTARLGTDGRLVPLDLQDAACGTASRSQKAVCWWKRRCGAETPAPIRSRLRSPLFMRLQTAPRKPTGPRSKGSIRLLRSCSHRRSSPSTGPSRYPRSPARRRHLSYSTILPAILQITSISTPLGRPCSPILAGPMPPARHTGRRLSLARPMQKRSTSRQKSPNCQKTEIYRAASRKTPGPFVLGL
jgi:RNA polymerase sigma factor (sigma-70 family)